MKQELGGYETRLLAELAEVVERGPRRRLFSLPRLAMGGVALAALAVTAGLTLPVFGGASERSPNVADSPVDAPPVEYVGFSLAVKDGQITVSVDDIMDGEALETALEAEGVTAAVMVLDGVQRDCEWKMVEGGTDIGVLEAVRNDDGGASVTFSPTVLEDGETLVIAVYETPDGDDTTVGLLVSQTFDTPDPVECEPIG